MWETTDNGPEGSIPVCACMRASVWVRVRDCVQAFAHTCFRAYTGGRVCACLSLERKRAAKGANALSQNRLKKRIAYAKCRKEGRDRHSAEKGRHRVCS